jgi:hypothetical protein
MSKKLNQLASNISNWRNSCQSVSESPPLKWSLSHKLKALGQSINLLIAIFFIWLNALSWINYLIATHAFLEWHLLLGTCQ